MSEQVENVVPVESVQTSTSTMSFEDFLTKGHASLKQGRKTKTITKFGEFLGLNKGNKVRKFFLEILEKKVKKELNLEDKEVDWAQMDWNVVWDIIKALLPLLLLIL